jgi:hypothetical protein
MQGEFWGIRLDQGDSGNCGKKWDEFRKWRHPRDGIRVQMLSLGAYRVGDHGLPTDRRHYIGVSARDVENQGQNGEMEPEKFTTSH